MLVKANLESDLAAVFEAMPASPVLAAAALAKAYVDYAKAAAATFGLAAAVVTDEHEEEFAATLLEAIELPALGLPATFAAAWAAAVGAFWTLMPVAGAWAGTTPNCPGASSLTGSLTTVFANLANTPASCAASLATELDTATKTVTANVAPPPGTVSAIA